MSGFKDLDEKCTVIGKMLGSLIEHRNPGPQGQVTEKGFAVKLLPFELLKTMFCPPTVELATFYGVG